MVLSLDYYSAEEFRSTFSEGDIGTLAIRLLPKEWRKVTNAIGGNIRLLRNGKIEPELVEFQKSYSSSAPEQRRGIRGDPRSALGFNDEKLFLVTVDGRHHGYSMGMGFYDFTFKPFFRKKTPKLFGLAYEFQKEPSCFPEIHDLKLDGVISPKGFYQF